MMHLQRLLIISCLVLTRIFHVNAQEVPFEKGVNLTGWFQSNSAQEIHFTKYTQSDFENLQSLGCDVIRLPINLHHMTGGAPDYTLDTLFLRFLDSAVSWANQLDMHLILDNHTFDPSVDTDPEVGTILKKVWTQMATHYKNSYANIYYEILNEPHGIADATWNSIQQEVVGAIREIDTTHTIIIGPAGWNSFQNLEEMPEYEQDKLIYTFHFYEPFLFTHQGASWSDPSMEPLSGVPFPYDSGSMPTLPDALAGTWVEYSYNSYPQEGTAAHV
jgi:endoglucanase